MGANKPLTQNPRQGTSKSTYLLLVCSVLLAIVLIRNLALEKNGNEPKLSPKEEEKLQKRLREIDESEQYVLRASIDGWYPCLHSGRTTFYLKKGEVWKYGVTSKGEFGRYNAFFSPKTEFLILLSMQVLSRNA